MKTLTTSTLLSALLLAACSSGGSAVSSREPKGNPNAPVTVLEFADLECPACGAAHSQIVEPLLEKYGNDIRYEHKHFPLRSIHRYALDASEASECAADQGKFWEYIDIAFTNQDDLGPGIFTQWASELNLDEKAFNSCLKSHDKRDVVLADYKEGRDQYDVQGTPTFFVNGVRVQTGFDTLSEAIDLELSRLTQKL